MTNKETIFALLTSAGFNTAAACGVLANIRHESNYNPKALGDSGTSYGLCQWHNARWHGLKEYAAERGQDASAVETQVGFLLYELQKSYKAVYNTCINAKDTAAGAYDVAYTFCVKFERPANAQASAVKRGNTAKDLFADFSAPVLSSTGVSVTMTMLRHGSRGMQVKTLQRQLNGLGYSCGSVDGIFGDKTLAAVRAIQKAAGLSVDGIVGKDTWEAVLK